MASPFPGMDPYLEGPAFWADFHSTFLNCWREAVADLLPDNYDARMDETVNLVHVPDEEIQRIYPDIAVTRSKRRTRTAGHAAGTLLLEPVTIPHVYLDEPRQGHIEILNRDDRRLVAILELLSPTNKIGAGFGEYSRETQRHIAKENPFEGIGPARRRQTSHVVAAPARRRLPCLHLAGRPASRLRSLHLDRAQPVAAAADSIAAAGCRHPRRTWTGFPNCVRAAAAMPDS